MKGKRVRLEGVIERTMSDGYSDVKIKGSKSKDGKRIETNKLLVKKGWWWK